MHYDARQNLQDGKNQNKTQKPNRIFHILKKRKEVAIPLYFLSAHKNVSNYQKIFWNMRISLFLLLFQNYLWVVYDGRCVFHFSGFSILQSWRIINIFLRWNEKPKYLRMSKEQSLRLFVSTFFFICLFLIYSS